MCAYKIKLERGPIRAELWLSLQTACCFSSLVKPRGSGCQAGALLQLRFVASLPSGTPPTPSSDLAVLIPRQAMQLGGGGECVFVTHLLSCRSRTLNWCRWVAKH